MLESLSVKNYVLIDNLELEFNDGFSVLTGETGSGKSIILGALSLIMGEKADKESIRAGEEYAKVSAVFSSIPQLAAEFLTTRGIELEDDKLLINRVIKANGRSSFSVNGTPITRSDGAILGSFLLDIASQHENQSLLKSETLLSLLDAASDSDDKLLSYKAAYKEYVEKEKELQTLLENSAKAEEEKEYIAFCLNELDKADLKIGEEEELKEKAQLISASEFLSQSLYNINECLKSVSYSLSEAESLLSKAAIKDKSLSPFNTRLESGAIEIEDIHESLRDYLNKISFSEDESDQVNSRLSEIQRIKRRFGGSVERAIEIRDEYRAKLEVAENKDALIDKLTKESENAKSKAMELALSLSAKREKGALKLSRAVEENLNTLGMASAKFRVSTERQNKLAANGIDEVSFKLTANKGERESDISSSASGGELSRILLALKVSIDAAKKDRSTLLFDEIDSGLGGTVANSVALKLYQLSHSHQVLAITHLAQLAAKADNHYVVSKKEINGRTVSFINEVSGEERIKEISRLLSGEVNDISLKHAEKLLEEAKQN